MALVNHNQQTPAPMSEQVVIVSMGRKLFPILTCRISRKAERKVKKRVENGRQTSLQLDARLQEQLWHKTKFGQGFQSMTSHQEQGVLNR